MSHLGRLLGISMIKRAVLEETPRASSEYLPPEDDYVEQRISDAFEHNQYRDQMNPEIEGMYADKLGKFQEFDLVRPAVEGDLNRLPGKRSTVPKDSMDPNSDEAWDEHDAYESSRFPRVDYVANPGPPV